jgi:hypothetical protein
MKKNYLIAISLIVLASCGGTKTSSSSASSAPISSTATSSSSAAASSSASSSSIVSSSTEADFYINAMKNTPDYYSLSSSTIVKKGTSTLQNTYYAKNMDVTNQIEHLYKRTTTLAGYEENTDTTTEEKDTYQSATKLYEKGYDGKYHVSDVTRSDFAAYHLSFDFSKLTDGSVEYDGYDAILTAKVTSDNLVAFGEKDLSGVNDFTLSATLDKKEGILANFSFAYTQATYAVSVSYKFSSFASTIILPTV